MPEDTTFATLAISLIGGTFITVVSRKYALPTIVLLFAGGVVLGPSLIGWIQPEDVESFLPAMVSLAVAILLFEGGLTLEPRDYVRSSRMIKRLLTVGAVVTWIGSACAVRFCLNASWEISLLSGSLVIVTGPTVIIPLLRRLRLKPEVASILHWEGVLIDAVGVFIAVFCFELVVQGNVSAAFSGFALRLIAGVGIGMAGGFLLQWVLVKSFIPESLTNPFVLASAVFVFTLSESWIHESGLLAVTLTGIIVGRRRSPEVKQITTFKAELSDLLIGALFLLLVSRLDLHALWERGFELGLAVILVMVIIRPLNIWLSAIGTHTGIREKLFLSWIAPRGVVAASMATLFALQLESDPKLNTEAALLEHFTFSVIGATVILQGLTAGSWARILQVSAQKANGWMIVGAHLLGRTLAKLIHRNGFDVLLIDTDPRNIAIARMDNLPVLEVDAREIESIVTDAAFSKIRNILSLTDNSELNEWIASDWRMPLGRDHAFAWKTQEDPQNRNPFAGLPRPSVVSEELRKGSTKLTTIQEWGANDRVLFTISNHSLLPGTLANRVKNAELSMITLQRSGGYLKRALQRGGHFKWNCSSFNEIYERLADTVSEREPRISRENLLLDLTAQERILPPFLGHGIAAPHAYSKHIRERICLNIHLTLPIEVEGVEEPIHTVYFILSPSGDPEGHLATLAEIAKACHE